MAEADKTLKALQFAIQMEIDGKDYYLRASQESGNELGRKLMQSLAAEEDIHRQKFTQIYQAIQTKRDWPVTDFQPDRGQKLRTLFAEASAQMGARVIALNTELDAVKIAMAMENRSYDFYQNQSQKATYPAERDFYQMIAGEERKHHLILLDYYQYLKDPAAWFVSKEHPSLDGG